MSKPHETITPALEARLRRLAKKKGFVLRKSRRRLSKDNLGGYRLDGPGNTCFDGEDFSLEPDHVQMWLELPAGVLMEEWKDAMFFRQLEEGKFDHLLGRPQSGERLGP